MDPKVFGRFIAEVRKEKEMTQAHLAEIIGVSDKTISRWERGIGFPDINTIEPLANALDLSVLELMRSQRNMENDNSYLSNKDVIEAMNNAVWISRESQKQDKISIIIGIFVTIVVAVFVKMMSNTNIGGAIFVGLISSVVIVSIYFFIENRNDKNSRRIYSCFMFIGLAIVIKLFLIMAIETDYIVWGIYLMFFIIIWFLNK